MRGTEDFDNAIRSILNKEEASRQEGERVFRAYLQASPESVAKDLLRLISHPEEDVAGLAAVLLRKQIEEENFLNKLSIEAKSQLKSVLLSMPNSTWSLARLKKLGDILIILAISENWLHELLGYMGTWTNSGPLKELGLYLFLLFSNHQPGTNILRSNSASVMNVLWASLQDPEVSISAAKSILSFLICLEDIAEISKFSQALDLILLLLNNSTSPTADDCLGYLRELSELCPELWSDKLDLLTGTLTNLASNTANTISTRSASVEVLIALASNFPTPTPTFAKETLTLCFLLMTEARYPYDIDAWNGDIEENNISDAFNLGRNLISVIGQSMPVAIFPFMMQLAPAHIQASHWARQQAGILAIGLVADKQYIDMIPDILNWLHTFLTQENPRLKWASLTALGLLCSEFEQSLQIQFHNEITSGISGCLGPENCSKVIAQAAKSLINYSQDLQDEVVPTVLLPYIPGIFQKYYTLLSAQQLDLSLLSELTKSLSVLISVIAAEASAFYTMFIPGLLNIAVSPIPKGSEVRAAAVRCITALVVNSTSEYSEHILEVASELFKAKQNLDDCDPAYFAILESVPEFALVLKEKFDGFLEISMQEVLTNLQRQVDFCLTDQNSAEPSGIPQGSTSMSFEVLGHGWKQITINTNALEQKVNAAKLVYHLISSLGTSFEKYILTVVQVVSGLVSYSSSSDIRKYACKAISKVMNCTNNPQLKEQVILMVFPSLLEGLKARKSDKEVYWCFKALHGCLGKLQNSSIIGLANAYSSACAIANFLEGISRSEEFYVKNLYKIMDIIGILLKAFKRDFHGCFMEMLTSKIGNLMYSSHEDELVVSLCIFDDFVMHTGDLLVQNEKAVVLERFIEMCYASSPNVRQSAAYGVGLAAVYAHEDIFTRYKDHAVRALQYVLALPESKNIALESAETAACALGKIALKFDQSLVPAWLEWMPFKTDPEEARLAFDMLTNSVSSLSAYRGEIERIGRQAVGLGSSFVSQDSLNKLGL